ncbi:cation:proton antiporter [Methanobacterium alcaliphilum]|uniref:cation:proton antiporter n=1 Tax=Methanobacterium alcaliphilum TaxID=392018 RepID=UPI00200BA0B4|nr:cation:proton antiporter [Methanobacterium alcaliphilum]MCK9151829.1 cation:proton antiporter [Methanobacterium alcaliphilum]
MVEVLLFLIILFIIALISRKIDKLPVTAQMIVIFSGILAGFLLTGFVDINQPPISTMILVIAEVALVLVLFTDASRVKLGDIRSNFLTIRLLSLGLVATIILGIASAILIFTKLNFWEAAIIGVVLAPTDAALGQIVVQNQKIPERIREALEVESGLNDGLCVPFLLVFIAIGLAQESFSPSGYFIDVALAQIGLGALVGIVIGAVGSKIVIKSRDNDWITPDYQRIAFLVLAVLSFLIADEIGGSGFIAAFIGGLASGYITRDAGKVLLDFAQAEGQFLNLAVFFMLGIVIAGLLPYLTWQIVLYSILSLTIIRMLPVALSLWGTPVDTRSIIFMGWFGPRGLASIVLALIALERVVVFPGQSTFILAVFTTVLFSVVAHGITALPLSEEYVKRLKFES